MTMLTETKAPTAVIDLAGCAKRLAEHILPDTVVATRPKGDSGDWLRGDQRDVMHNGWLIQTADVDKVREVTATSIAFDTVIDVDGVLLSDPDAASDWLAKKLLCIDALTTGLRGNPVSAQNVLVVCNYFDWLVRWRRSIGVAAMRDLEPLHFADFVSRISGMDILDLLPMSDRAAWLDEEIKEGRYAPPVYEFGGILRLDWPPLATKMGVTLRALLESTEFRLELVDRKNLWAPDAPAGLFLGTKGLDGDEGKDEQRTSRSVTDVLAPWEYLVHLTDIGWIDHDPLTFAPFKDKSSYVIASEIGKERNRTPTLLPDDFFRLMNAASTWVLDYSDHVIEAVALLRDPQLQPKHRKRLRQLRQQVSEEFAKKAPAGFPPMSLAWRLPPMDADTKPGTQSLGEVVKHLMTACAIIVAGFGARRVGEVNSLKTGCLIEEKPGLCEITIYIEKTLRDVDRIPVPALVKTAIDVLERLTDETRTHTGEDWLFAIGRNHDSDERGMLQLRLANTMDPFAEVNGLEPPEGQSSWSLRPHQLRRGFAVFYYHGFRTASLDALSRLLRHYDPEMTRIYINESVAGSLGRLREEIDARTRTALGSMSDDDRRWLSDAKKLLDDLSNRKDTFNDVRCEALVHRMLRMWDGAETPIGHGAKRLFGDLDAMAAKAQTSVRIGSRSNDPDAMRLPLAGLLKTYAKSHYLEPVPGHVAHCVCRPGHADDLAMAECLKAKAGNRTPWGTTATPGDDTRPDYAFSGAYACLTCAHCAAFSDNQKVVATSLDRLNDSVVRAATPAAKETAAEKYARLKNAVASAKAATKDRA